MKIVISSAIAIAAATVSAPALAAEGNIVDGFGSFSAGYNVLNPGSTTFGGCDLEGCGSGTSTNEPALKGLDLNARVSVAVPLGGAFGAQVDGEYSRTVYRGPATGDLEDDVFRSSKLNDSTVAAHVFARTGQGLVGVVAQRTSTNSNGGMFGPFGLGAATYYLGGEGQFFLGKATVYGQLAYRSDDATWSDSNGINAGLQLRYFPQDNLKLTLRGGYEFFKVKVDRRLSQDDANTKFNTVAIGANAEYRLAGSSISILGDVDYRAHKVKDFYGYVDSYEFGRRTAGDLRLMVGVKLNFGSTTLIERDRSGASLDPVRSLGQHVALTNIGFMAP